MDEIDYFSMEYAVVVLLSLLVSGAATGENKVIRVGKEHKSLPVYRGDHIIIQTGVYNQ